MIHFFENPSNTLYAVQSVNSLSHEDINKLNWLFGDATKLEQQSLEHWYVGPRAFMVTPCSTNAVEIAHNMGIQWISLIVVFKPVPADFNDFDTMISQKYSALTHYIYTIVITPEPIIEIVDIEAYYHSQGL